ncbi:MAG: PAS domain S-box protein [Proteobacteria bacterium]|nr:PAS domain S-box protein [Pseudomonadota bacterium]
MHENKEKSVRALKKTLRNSKGKKKAVPEIALEIFEEEINDQNIISQALAVEHVFRKSIEEAIPCGIIGFDLDGKQIYVNDVFSRMTGWKKDELLETTWPFIYWPSDIMNEYRKIFDDFKTRPSILHNIELPFKCKDGSYFWGLISSSLICNSEGEKNGLLISVTDITRRKTAENRLRVLSARLIDAQENERKRISQEIHDSLCGKLTGIKYGLEEMVTSLRPPDKKRSVALENLIHLVKVTIDETQRISRHLRPSVLDDLGILAAIRDISREFQMLYSHITFSSILNVDETLIPESIKILIFRVAQEAITNACRHSQATSVKIYLKKKKSHIELGIVDNGIGFEADIRSFKHPATGMGISSMMERTELFNGRFRLITKPGKGTAIEASWPIA